MTQNGTSTNTKAPVAGVWAPAITFFDPQNDTLDLDAQAKYFKYLSQSGLNGLVVLGTNAETFLLTRDERAAVLKAARRAVPPGYPLMAGVGGHSVAQVKEFIADAADAKADYALVLPAAYFGKATSNAVIESFYDDIAAFSPLPIVLYNFPGVCNGVDLDSALISKLVHRHANIVGVKLTCASVGKMTRLCAEFPASRFAVFGGQSDFLLGGMAVGGAGCIAAFGNVAPKTLSRIYKLYTDGKHDEALKLHQTAALAENATKGGIASVKYGASLYTAREAGIEGAEEKLRPRRPYGPPDQATRKSISDGLEQVLKVERTL